MVLSNENVIQKSLPGIVFCLIISIPAWYLGLMFPVVGGPVIAILAGIVINGLFGNKLKEPKFNTTQGVNFTAKKILQYSIILLGFEMNLFNVIEVGSQSLFVMQFTLLAAFLTAYILGKLLKLPGDVTTLIGVGTSICGGSAIAATAPVIKAKDEDVASSISTIFLFNIIAVFIFPALGHLLKLDDINFGIWAGTAINDTSSVVAATSSWSNTTGNDIALEFGTIVKLTRTLVIVPITLVLAVYMSIKTKHSEKENFSIAKVFPWFILLFVLAAVANTFLGIPEHVSKNIANFGKFLIVMSMAAIGLNTSIKILLSNGIKPIILGLSCWISVAVVAILVQGV